MGTVDGATPGDDGSLPASGLEIAWLTKQVIPGPVGSNITVDDVTLRVQNLRVIGDAGPTDQRQPFLEWATGTSPAPVDFANAPTGIYSKITLDLNGDIIDTSFEITGHATVNGNSKPFDIHDRNDSKITLDIDASVMPNVGTRLPIQVDFANALGVLDFATLDEHDGMLELDTNDNQMAAFRNQFLQSFKVIDSSEDH